MARFLSVILVLFLSGCKIGDIKKGSYVQARGEKRCLCKVEAVYPSKNKIDVVCNIGDSLMVAKHSMIEIWNVCDPKEKFKVNY